MPTNDSTLVLEDFLATLLRHLGETSSVDTCMDKSFQVNLIFDNCAIHQTQRSKFPNTSSRRNLRTMSFEVPNPVERPLVPPCRNGDKRDTSPSMPRSACNRKYTRSPKEEQNQNDIPKDSLHQSVTRGKALTTIHQSCADAAAVAAAVHCKSRWSSSPATTIMSGRSGNAKNVQRPSFPVEHDVHDRFPTPPHPARRQVSMDGDNFTELSNASSHLLSMIDHAAEEHHVPNSFPNKDCNVIALVDQALKAITISFPDAVQRDVKATCHVMKCHKSHSLVGFAEKKWR